MLCASFITEATLVPKHGGSTLTFTVENSCQGENSFVKSVKAFHGSSDRSHFPIPICNIRFENGECSKPVGCSCLSHSLTGRIDNFRGDALTLVGELGNGHKFEKVVDFIKTALPGTATPEQEQEQDPPQWNNSLTMIVAVSASGVVVVTVIVVLVACSITKKIRERRSRPRSLGYPGRPLPLRPMSPEAEKLNQRWQSRRSSKTHSNHSYDEVVEVPANYIGTGASQDLSTAYTQSKGDTYYLHAVSSASDEHRFLHKQENTLKPCQKKFDDDGYILPSTPLSTERTCTKKDTVKPSNENSLKIKKVTPGLSYENSPGIKKVVPGSSYENSGENMEAACRPTLKNTAGRKQGTRGAAYENCEEKKKSSKHLSYTNLS
ncbi:uncharacterized protein [Littorina saxatilis]|uniref:Uncharacterized protein n=1 Tax=Littorina saxatilis TaxID=31220 RepID=A0AAN9ALL8_9CAEN